MGLLAKGANWGAIQTTETARGPNKSQHIGKMAKNAPQCKFKIAKNSKNG